MLRLHLLLLLAPPALLLPLFAQEDPNPKPEKDELPSILQQIEASRPKSQSGDVPPEVVNKVSRLIDDTMSTEEAKRLEAWKELKEMGNLAVPGLLAYYREKKPKAAAVRSILIALEDSKDPRTGPVLVEILNDKDPLVRRDAARAIGNSRYKKAEQALVARLEDPSEDEEVKLFCARAAAKLGSDAGFGALKKMLKSEDPDVRTRAVYDLGKYGGKTYVSAIATVLDDKDDLVRMDTVGALRAIGDKAVIGPLIHATHDQDYKIRNAAMDALRQITKRKTGNDPKAWQKWWGAKQAKSKQDKQKKYKAAEAKDNAEPDKLRREVEEKLKEKLKESPKGTPDIIEGADNKGANKKEASKEDAEELKE